MNYKITPTDNFIKEVKKIAKKHRSIKKDLEKLRESLVENPTSGTHLGNNAYKVRMAITSKGKGKSGGARVITYVYVQEETVFLISVYDKSEKDSISDAEIKAMIEQIQKLL